MLAMAQVADEDYIDNWKVGASRFVVHNGISLLWPSYSVNFCIKMRSERPTLTVRETTATSTTNPIAPPQAVALAKQARTCPASPAPHHQDAHLYVVPPAGGAARTAV